MQHTNWNDYQFLRAVKRHGSLSGAARRLSVDVTTVSRRIKALQSQLGTQLLERVSDGSFQLTPIGADAALRGEADEKEFYIFKAQITRSDANVQGSVR